ncbi:WSC-domain-containing protein [Wilcoxina mikolae CBS 423.85]|nr:WSC-domain-containing protein [Wilcoxina mikolae CBS 423.85]
MTVEKCVTFCTNQDYPLAGLEYGNECFCGIELQNNATYGQSGCDMDCTGNPLQVCGGPNRLTVYENSDYISPEIISIVGNWSSLGCYAEGKTERALSAYVITDPAMTVPLCVNSCASKGYSLAGVEYAVECYCDNYAVLNKTISVPNEECWMKCAGDKKTFCGGPDRLVIYSQSNSSYYRGTRA